MRIGLYNYNTQAWSLVDTTHDGNSTYKATIKHFSTFGLMSYILPIPADNSDMYILALVAVMMSLVIVAVLIVHYLVDRRFSRKTDLYLLELDNQIRTQRNPRI